MLTFLNGTSSGRKLVGHSKNNYSRNQKHDYSNMRQVPFTCMNWHVQILTPLLQILTPQYKQMLCVTMARANSDTFKSMTRILKHVQIHHFTNSCSLMYVWHVQSHLVGRFQSLCPFFYQGGPKPLPFPKCSDAQSLYYTYGPSFSLLSSRKRPES